MQTKESELAVGDVWQQSANRREVLESFGIGAECADLPLRSACAARGACFEEVRRALLECDQTAASCQADWAGASLTDLAEHIMAWHHGYFREQLPRLGALLHKVVVRHARRHPHLFDLQQIYCQFSDQLLKHLMREELAVFPAIRALDEAARLQPSMCECLVDGIRHAIQVMRDEHLELTRLLAKMRKLTFGFWPPGDATCEYRELLDSLEGLESDLRRGIHKEDDLLFACATAAEDSLLATRNPR
ncbi:MAG: hemerythrin domain-containing protein [Pirellulales bacterium]|nr:hemerythrin domain-containing protein [Pirellulales bacterium]